MKWKCYFRNNFPTLWKSRYYSAQVFRKSPLFYAIMEENWILMFFAHASKVKSNMSFLTACKFSQQVHSIWSWLESLDVGWEWSRNVPLNGENLLWSFSVSNWVENGAHLAEKNPALMDHFSHVHAEWVNWLSVYLFVCLSFSTLWPNSLQSHIWIFIHVQFWYFVTKKKIILWEKIVLVIEKNFWNSRLRAENLHNFWDS